MICSFQRYMGVWALKVTQLAHYPNFYVKYRTTLEVTGALFISSEKGTRGGSLSYNKTKLFIGRADPLSFWGFSGWLVNLLYQMLTQLDFVRQTSSCSQWKVGRCRRKGANGLPDSPLPQQCGGARFSDSPSKNSRREWDPWVGWGAWPVGQSKASDPSIFLAPFSGMCVISSLKLVYICVFILHLFVCAVCAGICAHIYTMSRDQRTTCR